MRMRLVGVVALVVLTAGCTGVLLGDDDLVFESGETLIENETLAENGYELQQSERQTFNETITVDGDENGTRIVVSSHIARYGVESDLPSGIGTVRIGLVTTPDATVAGQSVNPLLRMDSYERAFRYLPETDQQGFETYGNYTAEPFGESVNVTVLATETESDEETPEAFVHVMQVSRPTGDAVLAYAMHTAEEADEAPKIAALFSSLEYTPPEDVSES